MTGGASPGSSSGVTEASVPRSAANLGCSGPDSGPPNPKRPYSGACQASGDSGAAGETGAPVGTAGEPSAAGETGAAVGGAGVADAAADGEASDSRYAVVDSSSAGEFIVRSAGFAGS